MALSGNGTSVRILQRYDGNVSVDPTKRFLMRGGQPWLMAQDAAWSMNTFVSLANMDVYFSDRANRGFNSCLLEIIERNDNFHPDGANADGDTPFTGTTGGQPDFTTLRSVYWTRVDQMIDKANSYGIVPLIFPLYLGAVGGRDGWYVATLANGSAKMQTYIQTLATRFANKNVLWVLGGDLSAASTPTPLSATGLSILNDMADALHTAAPNALISAHWAGEDQGSSTKYGNANLHIINGIYAGPLTHTQALADYAITGPTIPFYGLEQEYANESTYTDVEVRSQSWQIMTSGGAGVGYGNGRVWNFDGPASTGTPWQANLGNPSTVNITTLLKFFRRIPWQRLVPGNCVTSGGGTQNTNTFITAAATALGDCLVAFVPTNHTGSFDIDMTKLRSTATASWFDPTSDPLSNGFTTIGSFANSGSHTFTVPGTNTAGDSDWVLLITSP